MLNNQGTESKYATIVSLDGVAGIKGDVNGLPCYAETQIRVEVNGVGGSNVIAVEARLRNSSVWTSIKTITGAISDTADISTYDFVRYNVTTANGAGSISASGFFFKLNSGGGGSSVWGGITGTLSNQTDLQTALNAKAPIVSPTFTGITTSPSLTLNGTAGNGFVNFINQSSAPSTPASGFAEFADASGRKSWKTASDGFIRTWDSAITADRVFTLPDANGTLVLGTGATGQVSFWGSTNAQAGSNNFFWDNTNNRLGLMGAVPTHTVTHSSTSNGTAFYNTVDQTVNYERVRKAWSGNLFSFTSEFAGTGSQRDMQFVSGTSIFNVGAIALNGFGGFYKRNASAVVNVFGIGSSGLIGSTVFQNNLTLSPLVNQTSTAGFRGLFITPQITAVGSSGALLIDAGTNTTLDANGTHTSVFSVSSIGNIITSNTATSGHAFHNQTDQVTNFEKVQMTYSSNIFSIASTAGGTGVFRDLRLANRSGSNFIGVANSISTTGAIQLDTSGASYSTAPNGIIRLYTQVSSTTVVVPSTVVCPTFNGSSTGGFAALVVSANDAGTGTGGKYLIDLGTNSAAGGSYATHTSKFTVDMSGNIQQVNSIWKNVTNSSLTINSAGYTGTNSGSSLVIQPAITLANTSGTNNIVAITPTYNQVTATTANYDLLINRTETSVGSGSQRLFEAQVAGVSRFSIANTGRVGVNAGAPGSTTFIAISVASTDVVARFRGAVSQSGNLIVAEDSSGTEQMSVKSNGQINFATANTATTATAGAQILPATPTGFIIAQVNGTTVKIPYYSN